jgi:hypothetical protein
MDALLVQFALCDNASVTKPVEVPLPLTHATLIAVASKKFKAVTRQSRLFDGVSGEEILPSDHAVELETGDKVVCSGKAGWKGAERLRGNLQAAQARQAVLPAELPAPEGEPGDCSGSRPAEAVRVCAAESRVAAWASARVEERATVAPLQLQLVSFSYDRGPPRDTLVNLNARVLPNPGKSAKGRTGLDKRLAREVLCAIGASELCERVAQEALNQLHQLASIADGPWPTPVRVGVGCDRGLHRSVAVAEAATALLARKAEKARSGRNRPGLEALLRGVELLDAEHRGLVSRTHAGLTMRADCSCGADAELCRCCEL